MTLDRLPHHFSKTLLLASFSIGAIFVGAQTESNDEVSIAETEISEEFEILNVLELQTHQTERYEKLKEELKKSQFSDEHQELIATALSQSVVGAPISSYREESFVEGTDVDPTEEVQTLSILETGMVEDDDASFLFIEWCYDTIFLSRIFPFRTCKWENTERGQFRYYLPF